MFSWRQGWKNPVLGEGEPNPMGFVGVEPGFFLKKAPLDGLKNPALKMFPVSAFSVN